MVAMSETREFYGVMRRSKRFELYCQASGAVTIRRFSDGKFVFLSDKRAEKFLKMQKAIELLTEPSFDSVMSRAMDEAP